MTIDAIDVVCEWVCTIFCTVLRWASNFEGGLTTFFYYYHCEGKTKLSNFDKISWVNVIDFIKSYYIIIIIDCDKWYSVFLIYFF